MCRPRSDRQRVDHVEHGEQGAVRMREAKHEARRLPARIDVDRRLDRMEELEHRAEGDEHGEPPPTGAKVPVHDGVRRRLRG